MKSSEAISFLIDQTNKDAILSEKNRDAVQSALNCLRNDKETSVNALLKILSCAEGRQKTLQDSSTDRSYDLTAVLLLLADLGAKEAFPNTVCALSSEDENDIFDRLDLDPDSLGTELANIISDEDDAAALEKCVFMQDIHTGIRFSAYWAVSLYCLNSKNIQYLESFYEKLLCCFGTGQFEPTESHRMLVSLLNICIQCELKGLCLKGRDLLIRQLEIYPHQHRSNSFTRDYHKILFKLDPPVKEVLNETCSYLMKLDHCIDKKIFEYDTLEDVGRYLFEKTLTVLQNTDKDIIRLAVRTLQCYPYNNRQAPCTDTQYYEELCYRLDITQPPKNLYLRAKNMYNDIFVTGYQKTYDRIGELIRQTKEKRNKVKTAFDTIIGKANKDHSVKKDIRSFEDEIIADYFKVKELHALYDDKDGKEHGLLVFYQKSLESLFDRFCGENRTPETADKLLRQIVLNCIRYGDVYDTVDDRLLAYETVLKQFDYLLADTPELTLKKLFYKVKFLPFAAQIEDDFKTEAFKNGSIHNWDDHEFIQVQMRRRAKEHPLYPESLMQCADEDLNKYMSVLETEAPCAIAQIRKALSSSGCLLERSALIERSLQLLETRDDEVVVNLLPIQIEGLFSDLFEYSSIYACTSDMRLYRNIIHSELVETIQHSISQKINLTLDAIAYFKYYFSSIVRNTVAHGKHKLLVERWQIDRKECENKYDAAVYRRIIVLELLLDLNYLIQTISITSEVDAAVEYVNTTAACLTKQRDDGNSNNDYFCCLLDDLMGKRESLHKNHYKSGFFTSYDPLQILFWCFNPYFEMYFDDRDTNLNTVRNAICSSDFWNYVKVELASHTFQKVYRENLRKIIKEMLRLGLPPEISTILKEINGHL